MSEPICSCGHGQHYHVEEGGCFFKTGPAKYDYCECGKNPDGVELEIADAELARLRADNAVMLEALKQLADRSNYLVLRDDEITWYGTDKPYDYCDHPADVATDAIAKVTHG